MVKTRAKAFQQAHELLSELRNISVQYDGYATIAPQKIAPLRALNKLLIKEISRAERKGQRTKACLKTVDPIMDADNVNALSERLEDYRNLAYNWRCFGDAVAFLFMDKFALKQTFYNTHNCQPKQDAGFLIGKSGLQLELDILHTFLDNGIPALLTDLTNSIQYGDVVLMVGPDPEIIEVKSGKLDQRGKRQLKSIRQLNKFFATDEIENFRGLGKLQRVSHDSEETNYVDTINECITSAMESGFAWRSPEEGLHYLAIADDRTEISEVMKEMDLNQPLAFLLNEAKSNRVWSPYSPYTLSIRNRDALVQFVRGELILVVFYDLDVIRRLVEQEGNNFELLDPDSHYVFEISQPEGAGFIRMGRHLFNRLAYEFSSPVWLLRIIEERLNCHEESDESGSPIA